MLTPQNFLYAATKKEQMKTGVIGRKRNCEEMERVDWSGPVSKAQSGYRREHGRVGWGREGLCHMSLATSVMTITFKVLIINGFVYKSICYTSADGW